VYTNIELMPACPFFDRVARVDDVEGQFPIYRGRPGKEGNPASPDYCAFWHYVLPGGVVIVDEADAYFDCTDHSAVGADIRLFHKQHRKLGLDLIYIVQNIQNLYIRIRRLAQRFVLCEWNWRSGRLFQMLGGFVGMERAMNMSRFLRADFGCEDFSPRSHISDGYITYPEAREKYFRWYTTEQLLGDTTHLRWLHERQQEIKARAVLDDLTRSNSEAA